MVQDFSLNGTDPPYGYSEHWVATHANSNLFTSATWIFIGYNLFLQMLINKVIPESPNRTEIIN